MWDRRGKRGDWRGYRGEDARVRGVAEWFGDRRGTIQFRTGRRIYSVASGLAVWRSYCINCNSIGIIYCCVAAWLLSASSAMLLGSYTAVLLHGYYQHQQLLDPSAVLLESLPSFLCTNCNCILGFFSLLY